MLPTNGKLNLIIVYQAGLKMIQYLNRRLFRFTLSNIFITMSERAAHLL